MSFMDKNSKSEEETFGPSLSSSSRRVMWKLSNEEETFDTVVSVAVQQTKPQQEQPNRTPKRSANENWLHLLKEMRKKRSSTNLASKSSKASLDEELERSNSKARMAYYWHRLCNKKLKHKDNSTEDEAESAALALSIKPSLALRYKPSHESLNNKSEKSPQHQQEKLPRSLMTDLKLESCGLPPQQSCVVREVAPKFAQRLRLPTPNDTDSCCSGELGITKTSPASRLLSHAGSLDQRPRPRSEIISVHVSTPSGSAFVKRGSSTPKHRRANTKLNVTTTNTANPATLADSTSASKIESTCSSAANKSPSASSNGNANYPNFRQRMQELHRYRVQIEQRRLDLLELKIAREREEAIHQEILFHKDLQIKENQIKSYEDNDCSNA